VISSFNTVNKKFLLITRVATARNRIVGRSIVNATVLEADAWNLADVLSGKYYLFYLSSNIIAKMEKMLIAVKIINLTLKENLKSSTREK